MIDSEDLEPDLEPFKYYLDAFRELSTCRNNSMSLGAIPFTAILEYFKIFGVGDFDEFLYFIRIMDNVFLDEQAKKEKKSKEKK